MRCASPRRAGLVVLLPLLGLAPGCEPDDGVRVGERFEVVLPLAVEAANPFDPDSVRVRGEFLPPDGGAERSTPGFVYRDFDREVLADGRERLSPAGGLEWRVRFTFTEPGPWRWRWVRETPGGREEGAWQPLQVHADPAWRGFLRRSPADDRHLVFDDGSAFFAVGENLAWYDARGTGAYEAWIPRLAAQGATYIRLWMPSWAFGLVYAPAELDDWSERLDRAWQLDRVLALAEEHGLRVMLSLQNHGPFELGGFFGSEWGSNLYNEANGGPLAAPSEFWSDPRAREVFRSYLRYAVARWGHSATILCWELWNEGDLAEQPPDVAQVVDWHREMARHLRELDPNRHLITTSTSDELMTLTAWLGSFPIDQYPLLFDPVWRLPEIDFVQLHTYQIGAEGFRLAAEAFLPDLVARMRQYGKPVLVAEAGVDFRGPGETLAADPEGHGLHDLLWAGVFAESFGTSMSWWWDNVVDPQDWYFHWGPVARLVEGVAFHREGFERRVEPVDAPGRHVEAQVLAGRSTLLAWIRNRDHVYWAPDLEPVEPSRLAIPGVEAGVWRGSWIDPWTGAELPLGPLEVDDPDAGLHLDVPEFSRDQALRLEREDS